MGQHCNEHSADCIQSLVIQPTSNINQMLVFQSYIEIGNHVCTSPKFDCNFGIPCTASVNSKLHDCYIIRYKHECRCIPIEFVVGPDTLCVHPKMLFK